jgi:hypothetical protein
VSPDIARFQGAWIGTWHDDRHILVVERVKADGHANVVFAQSHSAIYGMNREWWRDQATIADGVLTMTGFRTFRYAFDGPDRLYMTAPLKSGDVTSGTLVRTDATRLAAGDRPIEWPWPGERVWIPHLTVRLPMAPGRSCSKQRSIRLPVLVRRRSRFSTTGPTSAAIS